MEASRQAGSLACPEEERHTDLQRAQWKQNVLLMHQWFKRRGLCFYKLILLSFCVVNQGTEEPVLHVLLKFGENIEFALIFGLELRNPGVAEGLAKSTASAISLTFLYICLIRQRLHEMNF